MMSQRERAQMSKGKRKDARVGWESVERGRERERREHPNASNTHPFLPWNFSVQCEAPEYDLPSTCHNVHHAFFVTDFAIIHPRSSQTSIRSCAYPASRPLEGDRLDARQLIHHLTGPHEVTFTEMIILVQDDARRVASCMSEITRSSTLPLAFLSLLPLDRTQPALRQDLATMQ